MIGKITALSGLILPYAKMCFFVHDVKIFLYIYIFS